MKENALKDLMRECSALITEKTQEIYNLVSGSGDLSSNVMVVTTYPTAKEEMTGIYFEGKVGQKYDEFLKGIGYDRDTVYTTYAVKYRPYKISEKTGRIVNRDVTMEEVRMFYPFIASEIALVKPKVIITIGDLAYSAIHQMSQDKAAEYGELMPVKIEKDLYEVMPMPHPSESGFAKVLITEALTKRLKFLQVDEAETFTALEDMVTPEDPDKVMGKVVQPHVHYDKKEIPIPKRKKKSISGKHKLILVYGGSQLSNDPTYAVADQVSHVLNELNVSIKRIDLYKNDYRMEAFLDELQEADGVILATTVEWFGIGGYMQTFLDKAYKSGQFNIFEGTYLLNIVVSRHSFEREASNHLLKSWEILGGIEGVNICASIESSATIETNNDLLFSIEKKTEDFYRIINQQRLPLPNSINNNKIILKVTSSETVDEGEQLVMQQVVASEKKEETVENQMSFISNYDEFIEKQQQDINDIASLFKERLSTTTGTGGMALSELFEYKFKPDKKFEDCKISWVANDAATENFIMDFKGSRLKTRKGRMSDADVIISSSLEVVEKITEGKLTVQRAFMTGEIKAKGNFTLLYKLDGLFAF